MNRDQLISILNNLKKELNIVDNIRLELRPMKIKAASISIQKGILRINKNILPYLNEESVKYLILHELIHYKLKSTYHTEKFYRHLKQKIKSNNIKILEENIINALLQVNHITTKKFQW